MADQEYRDSLFIPEDNRENFKQIIAKRSDLVRFDGGRLKNSGSGLFVTWRAGTVLGYATSGADSGKYKAYDDTNTDGSQTAVGVLSEDALVDDAGNGSEISIIRKGCLFADLLIGMDAAGRVDLGARTFVEHGTNLIEF